MKKILFFSILLFVSTVSYWYGQKSAEDKFQEELVRDQDKYFDSMPKEQEFSAEENAPPPELPVVQESEPQLPKKSSGMNEALNMKKELNKMGFDSTIEKSKSGRHLTKVKTNDPRLKKLVGQKKDNLVDEVEWNNYGVPEEVSDIDAEKSELSSGK